MVRLLLTTSGIGVWGLVTLEMVCLLRKTLRPVCLDAIQKLVQTRRIPKIEVARKNKDAQRYSRLIFGCRCLHGGSEAGKLLLQVTSRVE